VVFSPNGEYIASASKDSTVIIWRKNPSNNNFEKYRTLEHFNNIVWSVDFSRSSNWILCVSTNLETEYPRSCHIGNLKGDWVCMGLVNNDTTEYNPLNSIFEIQYEVTGARFNENNASIIIRTNNKLVKQRNINDDGSKRKATNSYRLLIANESNWRIMSRSKLLNNYGFWNLSYIDRFNYDGIDMSVNEYIAATLTGTDFTTLYHWDGLPIGNFKGKEPRFSPSGNYLLLIEGNKLKLHVSDEHEIIRLVKEDSIFGALDINYLNWLNMFLDGF